MAQTRTRHAQEMEALEGDHQELVQEMADTHDSLLALQLALGAKEQVRPPALLCLLCLRACVLACVLFFPEHASVPCPIVHLTPPAIWPCFLLTFDAVSVPSRNWPRPARALKRSALRLPPP